MTKLVFTTNKKHLLKHFLKDPVLFAYHIGDLDEFHFPLCQWAADYHQRAKIEEAVLIYSGSKIPTVMAFGLGKRFPPFLSELIDLLPKEFHGHYQKASDAFFEKNYTIKRQGTFWKMKLVNPKKAGNVNGLISQNVVRLGESHAVELDKFYQSAYPDGFFDKRELRSGKYFGYLISGQIVSVAGVHVDSEEHGVIVLGSIATLPEFRGQGYAKNVTARLLQEIADARETIMLNVDSKNTAAVKCYSNLGFEKTHEYEEGLFILK